MHVELGLGEAGDEGVEVGHDGMIWEATLQRNPPAGK
jgi:hypothetical protein